MQRCHAQLMRTIGLFIPAIPGFMANAQTTFSRHYGGQLPDLGFCVEQVQDGGFILCGGTTQQDSVAPDMYLVRTDGVGNEQWSRVFGTGQIEFAYSVVPTMDGGYVICGGWRGFGADTLALIKVDGTGGDQWSRRYPIQVDRSIGYDVIEADNGDLLCTGFAGPNGDQHTAILRVEPDGDPVWNTIVDLGVDDAGTAIRRTSDGYVVLTNTSTAFGADGDVGLIRLNEQGDTLWTRRFATAPTEEARGLAIAPNGDIIIAAFRGSVPADVLLMRTDPMGMPIWSQTYGSAENHDEGLDVEMLPGGDIVVAGRSGTEPGGPTGMLLMRCDGEGVPVWEHTYFEGMFAVANSVCATADGGFALFGYTISDGVQQTDCYLVKTDAAGYTTIGEQTGGQSACILLYPVPADQRTTLMVTTADPIRYDVHVLDLTGRCVLTLPGATAVAMGLDCSDLPSGHYTVVASDGPAVLGIGRLQVVH